MGDSHYKLQTVNAFHLDNIRTKDIDPALTSCNSLVRVCMPINAGNDRVLLKLEPPPGSKWAHLAETTFFTDSSTCPPDIVLNQPTAPPLSSLTAAVITPGYTDFTTAYASPVATTSGDNVPTTPHDTGFHPGAPSQEISTTPLQGMATPL